MPERQPQTQLQQQSGETPRRDRGDGRSMIGGRYRPAGRPQPNRIGESCPATDLRTGEDVIVQTVSVRDLPPGAVMRLEHEARLRRRIENASLARLNELLREGDTFHFVWKAAPGAPLVDRLGKEPLPLRDAVAAAICLFSALRDLHQRGMLHRNVRPANIRIPETGPVRSAVLVGGGVPEIVRAGALQEQNLEIAWCMSPEQAGSIDHDVGEPADLYSAGIVLFHSLTGQPPFTGDDIGAVLFEHVTASVPELGSLGVASPRALDEIIQRLLRKDPRDRYQSADAVLRDLEDLAKALDRGERDPALAVGSHDRRCTLTEPAFVARRRELELLDEQLARTAAGKAGLVLIEGRSGDGKSRLLMEVSQRAARDGLWVLRGNASTEVGQRPFRLLEGVVDQFLAKCRADLEFAASIRRKLGGQWDAVCAALPQLAEVLPPGGSPDLAPEAFGEARTLRALGDFLEALGAAERPAVVILDDCQWADELTSKLIARWSAGNHEPAAAPHHVLVLAAFRSDETPAEHLLRRLQPAAHLQLAPLSPEDVRRLAESMAGPLPDEAIEVVTRLGEGSPFMSSATLRGLVESGALVADGSGWRIEPLALASLQSSSRAASFLTRRIELLPPATADLLSAASVLGKEFDLDAAARLARQQPADAINALDEARRRQLVWARPSGGNFIFVHDKIRAALLHRLSEKDRKQLHREAALDLQHREPDRSSDLAYHFDAAGDQAAALPFALEAAETARAQHALEIAEQQYRIAERGAESTDGATRFRIAEGLGDVLMLRGRYDAAAPLFKRAASLADGPLAQAEIGEKLAELAFKRGDKEAATLGFEATLRKIGCSVPRSVALFSLVLAWEAAVQILHTWAPRWFLHRRPEPPSPEIRLQLRLLSRLAHSYWFTRGKIHTLWAHLRGMNLGEVYPPTLELANAYSEHAPAMSLVPMFRRACAYSERSLEIRKAFGDLWGQGQSLTFYGCVLYYSSRYEECIEKCREAIRLLERMGDYWLVHIARYQLAASLYHLGDLRGAVEECRRNHRSGLDLQDEQASGIILDVWTRATGGDLPPGILQTELSRDRQDPQGVAQVLFAEGVRLLGAGDPSQAAKMFRTAIGVARRAGVHNAYTLPSLTWLTTALRRQAEQMDAYQAVSRGPLLRQAAAAARTAIRAARICRNDLPQAYREYALISAMLGRREQSQCIFRKSIAEARRQQSQYELGETLLARGRVGRLFGWPGAFEDLEKGELLVRELQSRREGGEEAEGGRSDLVTLSLADRFDTVLEAGRRIASALNRPAIYEEARLAALRLLRGERCQVLELDDELNVQAVVSEGGDAADFAAWIIGDAVAAERAVAYSDPVAEEPLRHGEPRGGSVICVPIHVRGRTAACLYITHRHMRGLFGPDEERLADFIAAIAGAALENAEGFHQLQVLNVTLEERVAERAAAAEARAQELTRSNEELERTADELRRTEEQLRDAIDAAESASRAKTQFLTTMSHEIRTPMNGILGMTELALAASPNPQQRSYLSVVKQSGEALLTLLNDILDLSKIEAGRMELESIPFDVREMTGGAVRLLGVGASHKGIELVCRVAPETPREVLGDPTRLRQILVNLVGNAIKFTSEGEVVVDVFVDETEPGDPQLHFAVSDTGIGIPQDKQATIFESFQQCDSSTTRRFGGTGLGLAICAQLVSLMNGRIWVESRAGGGSTFHVALPLEATDAAAPPPPLAGQRLLWFSSHSTSRRVYGEMLESSGAEVVVAENLPDAVSVLEAAAAAGSPLDAIVVDFSDADPDGQTLLRRVAEEPHLSKTPVVTLVAAGASRQPEKSGREFVLTKPAGETELCETLLRACRDARAPAAAAPDGDDPGRRRLRLLLAEDGLINQEVAKGLLEMAGHAVETVDNGREAWEAFQQGSFDAILMDLEMPEMDGLEAARRIRECEASGGGERIPIIAMTAHAVKGFREQCLEAGMDDYVTKPIDLRELLRALDAVVEPATLAPAP
jgi:signal transduction histidine kinase/CheY-like chemotaxis protein